MMCCGTLRVTDLTLPKNTGVDLKYDVRMMITRLFLVMLLLFFIRRKWKVI